MSDADGRAVLVLPEVTYPLRREVLDRTPTAAELHRNVTGWGHYAVITSGAVVATGIIHPQQPPALLGQHRDNAWRIIGMAVDPNHRCHGLGAMVLSALLAHASAAGGRFAWCHARIDAAGFYRRHGFIESSAMQDDPVAGRQLLMGLRLV